MAETRTEALIAAASLAYTALAGASCRDAESVSAGSETERECEAAQESLRAALAEWSYIPCYACGTPTPDMELIGFRYNDGVVRRECPSCVEFRSALRAVADANGGELPSLRSRVPDAGGRDGRA
jgi:hypothetical protein